MEILIKEHPYTTSINEIAKYGFVFHGYKNDHRGKVRHIIMCNILDIAFCEYFKSIGMILTSCEKNRELYISNVVAKYFIEKDMIDETDSYSISKYIDVNVWSSEMCIKSLETDRERLAYLLYTHGNLSDEQKVFLRLKWAF